MPITGQDFIASFRIVVNDMMKRAGTAECGASPHIAFRFGFAETLINNGGQIVIIALNRRIGNNFARCQGVKGFLYNIKHNEIAVFIQNGSDSTVNNLICTQFFGQCGGTVVGTENFVFRKFASCLRSRNTLHHGSNPPYLFIHLFIPYNSRPLQHTRPYMTLYTRHHKKQTLV